MFVNITIFVGRVEEQCSVRVKFLHRYIKRKSWSFPRKAVTLMNATPESLNLTSSKSWSLGVGINISYFTCEKIIIISKTKILWYMLFTCMRVDILFVFICYYCGSVIILESCNGLMFKVCWLIICLRTSCKLER